MHLDRVSAYIRKAGTLLALHWEYLGIVAIALLSQISVGPTINIDSISQLQVNPLAALHQSGYVWNSQINLGYDYTLGITYLTPNILFYSIGSYLRLPIWLIERAWYFGILATSGVGALKLYELMFSRLRIRSGRLLAGLAYMLAPYTLIFFETASSLLLTYAVLPILLYFFIQSTRHGLTTTRILGFVFFSYVGSFQEPPYFVLNFLVVLGYALYDALRMPTLLRALYLNVRKFAVFIAAVASSSIWWLIPEVLYFGKSGVESFVVSENPVTLNTNSSFLETFRLLGNSGFYGTYPTGQPYYPFAPPYIESPIIILVSFAIPILAILGLLLCWQGDDPHSSERRHSALFLGLLASLCLPLAVGAYPPASPGITGRVYLLLYDNLPFSALFKQSNIFVAPLALSFACLLPLVVEFWGTSRGRGDLFQDPWQGTSRTKRPNRFRLSLHSAHRPRRLVRRALLLIAFGTLTVIIIVDGLPILTGEVIPPNARYSDIPAYWTDAADWMNSQPGDFRILMTPDDGFPKYTWGADGLFAPYLFNQPVIDPNGGASSLNSSANQIVNDVFQMIANNESASIPALLNLLDVEFVINQHDLLWQEEGSTSPQLTEQVLNQSLQYVRQFGALDVYRNPSWEPSMLSTPLALTCISGGAQAVVGRVTGSLLYQYSMESFTWLNDLLTFQSSLRNFSIFSRVTIISGNYAALEWVNGSQYVSGQLRTDGSHIEESGIGEVGNATGFKARLGVWYTLGLQKNGTRFTFSINGTPVAQYTGDDLGSGRVGLATFGSVAAFANVTIVDLSSSDETYFENFSGLPFDQSEFVNWTSSGLGGVWEVGPSTSPPNLSLTSPQTAYVSAGSVSGSSLKLCPEPSAVSRFAPPHIQYETDGPSEFRLAISNASSTFLIVLNEAFSESWELCGTEGCRPPLTINSYSMGWLYSSVGNYSLTLIYTPQRVFETSVEFTPIPPLVLGLSWAVYTTRRNRARRRQHVRHELDNV
jgi:hypothetical protein